MAEPEVLYNFGVLTKRYELVSRTAGQLAPGIAGLLVGFFMIVAGAPLPLPFAPVLVGFWFALGKIPFGRHRGARVRTVLGPLARYWYLRLAGKTHWMMPAKWLSVAVDPAAASTLERVRAVPGAARRRTGRCPRETARPGTQDTERPKACGWPNAPEGLRAVAPRVGPAALDGGARRRVRSRPLARAGPTPEPADRGDLGVGRRPLRVFRTRRAGGADLSLG